MRLVLFEGSTCLSDDRDGSNPHENFGPRRFTLPECVQADGCAHHLNMRVSNVDEGDDFGELDVDFFNEQAP